MSGIGTKSTGFVIERYGPFNCGHCSKFDSKACACNDDEVRADKEVKIRLPDGRPHVDSGDCCNEFWPCDVAPERYKQETQTRSPHGFPSLSSLRREAKSKGESEEEEKSEYGRGES